MNMSNRVIIQIFFIPFIEKDDEIVLIKVTDSCRDDTLILAFNITGLIL